jgi:hypothetical protein
MNKTVQEFLEALKKGHRQLEDCDLNEDEFCKKKLDFGGLSANERCRAFQNENY